MRKHYSNCEERQVHLDVILSRARRRRSRVQLDPPILAQLDHFCGDEAHFDELGEVNGRVREPDRAEVGEGLARLEDFGQDGRHLGHEREALGRAAGQVDAKSGDRVGNGGNMEDVDVREVDAERLERRKRRDDVLPVEVEVGDARNVEVGDLAEVKVEEPRKRLERVPHVPIRAEAERADVRRADERRQCGARGGAFVDVDVQLDERDVAW